MAAAAPPPYTVALDPDQARRLATTGAALLLLDVPAGTLLGIDQQVGGGGRAVALDLSAAREAHRVWRPAVAQAPARSRSSRPSAGPRRPWAARSLALPSRPRAARGAGHHARPCPP
jgi:hypothetical protein